jgi:hypothetical protein
VGGRYNPEIHGKSLGQMGMLKDAEKLVCGAHQFYLVAQDAALLA